MQLSFTRAVLLSAALMFPSVVSAQPQSAAQAQPPGQQDSNVPAAGQAAEGAVERAVERFRIGVFGGVGIDPELIQFGAHGAFGPIFSPNVEFRPGLEFGLGELTTMFAINLDVLYTLPGVTAQTRWMPYIGGGPTFGLSHRSFETDDEDNVNGQVSNRNRFDFSDTNFDGGFNFIAGARSQGGAFFEMRASAGGVSSVRLLAGYNF